MTPSTSTLDRLPASFASGIRYADELIEQLVGYHEVCLRAHDQPFSPAPIIRKLVRDSRVRFTEGAGGRGGPGLNAVLVDAVCHAADNGYRLCLQRRIKATTSRELIPRSGEFFDEHDTTDACWLPAGHDGRCAENLWHWELLYGDLNHPDIMRVCTRCTPHRWVPRPDTCPHGQARATVSSEGGAG